MPKSKTTVEAPVLVVTPPVSNLDTQDNKASSTTVEEDLKSAGQRKINDVWEFTQAAIASLIVLTTCIGIIVGRVVQREVGPSAIFPPEWWTILGLVIGFYFGRTNHARAGDITK
jgi:hypothetical protein